MSQRSPNRPLLEKITTARATAQQMGSAQLTLNAGELARLVELLTDNVQAYESAEQGSK